jgi:hypothetical protein
VEKKNKIRSPTGKWIEVEIITLSKIRQTQEDKYHKFSLICRNYKKENSKKDDLKIEGAMVCIRNVSHGLMY